MRRKKMTNKENLHEDIKIRHARKEDAKAIWEVAESAYEKGSPWELSQFQELISYKNVLHLIASQTDGEIVALIIASKTMVEADIYMLAVKKSHQGKGIGKKIFKELIEELKSSDLETIFLEVRESNIAAKKVYQKLDFIEIGRRKDYYSKPKEDALMMKLDL